MFNLFSIKLSYRCHHRRIALLVLIEVSEQVVELHSVLPCFLTRVLTLDDSVLKHPRGFPFADAEDATDFFK